MSVTGEILNGLGNQLFIIYATMAYAKRHGLTAWFRPASDYGPRQAYWRDFLADAPQDMQRVSRGYREPAITYAEIPAGCDYLSGYFQSAKYFADAAAAITSELKLAPRREQVRAAFAHELTPHGAPTVNISIHFRLGDYKTASSQVLGLEYYAAALAAALADSAAASSTEKDAHPQILVWYFYEKEDEATIAEWITQLQHNNPQLRWRPVCSGHRSDWEDMMLMSCADHHVIANSTYSWWAAYLHSACDSAIANGAAKPTVVYPCQWFGNSPESLARSRDICPADWIGITV